MRYRSTALPLALAAALAVSALGCAGFPTYICPEHGGVEGLGILGSIGTGLPVHDCHQGTVGAISWGVPVVPGAALLVQEHHRVELPKPSGTCGGISARTCGGACGGTGGVLTSGSPCSCGSREDCGKKLATSIAKVVTGGMKFMEDIADSIVSGSIKGKGDCKCGGKCSCGGGGCKCGGQCTCGGGGGCKCGGQCACGGGGGCKCGGQCACGGGGCKCGGQCTCGGGGCGGGGCIL